MIISISGPQSTGKTTLLNKLKEQFPMYKFIDETFRKQFNGKQLNLDHAETAFLLMYDFCNNNYIESVNKNQICIMDRCGFDNIVYLTLHFMRLSDNLKKEYITKYAECVMYCKSLLGKVDHIFLTQSINNLIQDDNFRPKIYHQLFDQEIKLFNSLISLIDMPYTVLKSDVNERIEQINHFIIKNQSI